MLAMHRNGWLTNRRTAVLSITESEEGEPLVLTKDERQLLIRLVRRALEEDRYPMAPRLDPLKASMAGFLPGTSFGPSTATKFAVVGLSEALRDELAPQGIGVSVLCPGWVTTRIMESRRNWPKEYGEPPAPRAGLLDQHSAELVRTGMEPSAVAALTIAAIRADELCVFTHPHLRPPLETRVETFLAAYRRLGPAPQEKQAMKFGIFYTHQIPLPWDAESEHRIYREALEQVELADRVGIDYA